MRVVLHREVVDDRDQVFGKLLLIRLVLENVVENQNLASEVLEDLLQNFVPKSNKPVFVL